MVAIAMSPAWSMVDIAYLTMSPAWSLVATTYLTMALFAISEAST